jgi:hypothetical protein
LAVGFHDLLQNGHLLQPFTESFVYPPLVQLVGALTVFVGGRSVAAPIIGENVVFVSLLALGCYQAGRLLFGARAGLLAVIFVLGSPLLIAQFHVFMLDAPETALVAVTIWLLLASEDFTRAGCAAWAGVAVGCGLLIKEQFPLFIVGIVFMMLARGGWRNWFGLLMFAAVAFAVGAPWYLDHLSNLGEISHYASANLPGAPSGNYPDTVSTANLTWYAWSTVNNELFAAPTVLALVGTVWTIWAVVRERVAKAPGLEFLIGGVGAWLAITLVPHHDVRYGMPVLPYVAVIGTGWIVYVKRTVGVTAIAVLILAVAANTLSTTFGVGGQTEVKLVASPPTDSEALPDRVVLYSSAGFLVAGPRRDGDVPGLLTALRRGGVRGFVFTNPEAPRSNPPDFSEQGLTALAEITRLGISANDPLVRTDPQLALLVHRSIRPGMPAPCTRLSDGMGVWVVRMQPVTHSLALYCPFRHPHFYPGAVGSLVSQ